MCGCDRVGRRRERIVLHPSCRDRRAGRTRARRAMVQTRNDAIEPEADRGGIEWFIFWRGWISVCSHAPRITDCREADRSRPMYLLFGMDCRVGITDCNRAADHAVPIVGKASSAQIAAQCRLHLAVPYTA